MSYWWASQNSNYPLVIEAGTLWTTLTRSGQQLRSRMLIKDMRKGDLVFHYRGPAVQALSIVTHDWVDCIRPLDYSGYGDESEDPGWLVQVEPLTRDVHIHRDRVAELLDHGSPGPLDVNGIPQRKYLTRLTGDEGRLLLDEAESDVGHLYDRSLPGRPHEDWLADETDSTAVRAIRREQKYLRKHLLKGNAVARCSICRRVVPETLLIAGHIKRRSMCSPAERMDFDTAAMLVCSLGCDALFEQGYIVVDDAGMLREGVPATTDDLLRAVAGLSGHQCSAWNARTRSNFSEHRRHLGVTG
jgi:hypothetical protein